RSDFLGYCRSRFLGGFDDRLGLCNRLDSRGFDGCRLFGCSGRGCLDRRFGDHSALDHVAHWGFGWRFDRLCSRRFSLDGWRFSGRRFAGDGFAAV
ncbi:hypothetical protein, partial [Bowmanella yangjiangensis]